MQARRGVRCNLQDDVACLGESEAREREVNYELRRFSDRWGSAHSSGFNVPRLEMYLPELKPIAPSTNLRENKCGADMSRLRVVPGEGGAFTAAESTGDGR